MKQAWRFIKWFVSKCGWFEALMFTTAFTLSAGLAAGEGTVRNVFWGIAIGANGYLLTSNGTDATWAVAPTSGISSGDDSAIVLGSQIFG